MRDRQGGVVTNDAADGRHFLDPAPVTAQGQALFDEDLADMGFVMNVSRLWAYQPQALTSLFDLMRHVTSVQPLTLRERAILVAASASALGDSYCSVAWGTKLAGIAGPAAAADVLRGEDGKISPAEQAIAGWGRHVTRDDYDGSAADVQALRDAGFTDACIFEMTVFVSLRIALSTVNDALGPHPDAEYLTKAPSAVLDAVPFSRAGRPAPPPWPEGPDWQLRPRPCPRARHWRRRPLQPGRPAPRR